MNLGELLSFGAGAVVGIGPQIADRLCSHAGLVPYSSVLRPDLGLSDYQGYEALVAPDVVLTVAGALGALYEVEWNGTFAADDRARMAHSQRINKALNGVAKLVFGSAGWMPQTYRLRALAPPLEMPRYIDCAGRRVLAESHVEYLAGKRYRTRDLIALAYMPPKPMPMPWLKRLFVAGERPAFEAKFEKVLATFAQGLELFEDRLSKAGTLMRLGTHPQDRERSELLETIFEIAYGDRQPIRIGPFEPALIGELLAARDVSPAGLAPMVGQKHLRVLSAFAYPTRTHPAMFDAFSEVAAVSGLRFSTRMVCEDPTKARKKLEHARDTHGSKKTSIWSKMLPSHVDQYAAHLEGQSEQMEAEVASGKVSLVHLSLKAVLLNEDLAQLDEDVRTVRNALQQGSGLTVNLEDVNTIDAWLGMLPFNGYNDRREAHPVHTANASRLLVSTGRWRGRESWTCKQCGPDTVPAIIGLSRMAEDFAVDPHDGDSQSCVLYGRPGTRKTTTLAKIIGEYPRRPLDFIGGIDKNRGLKIPTLFMGGDYRERSRYWLFGNLESAEKRAFLGALFVKLCALNGYAVQHPDTIKDALELMLEDRHWKRSMSTFLGIHGPNDRDDGRVTDILGRYAVGGIFDGVFDGEYAPDLGSNQREVHELGHLLGGGTNVNEALAAPVLLWVLRTFEERMIGHRSLIVFDEVWAALQSELVAQEISAQLRTYRSKHSGVLFATHAIADTLYSPIGQVVTAACRSRFLFPNADANGALHDIYGKKGLGLTDPQIDALASAEIGECALSDGDRFAMFTLALSPAEAAIYGLTAQDDVAAASTLIEEHPDSWRSRLLNDRLCTKEAERMRSLERHHSLHPTTVREALSA